MCYTAKIENRNQFFATFFILCFLSTYSYFSFAQVDFTTIGTPYTQNFSGITASASNNASVGWTDNSNLTGWYMNRQTGAQNINTLIIGTATLTHANVGAFYSWLDGADRSLGSRCSGGTDNINFGVRIRNNTASVISSIAVSYTGEQWTIAENGANLNSLGFSYQVGATVTSVTSGSFTNVPALNFNQIYGSTNSTSKGGTACGGTSNQCIILNPNVNSDERVTISACFDVTIPVGQEIMLRWTDVDNGANDHQLQIDNLSVTPYDAICSVILPVEWQSFEVENKGETAQLDWVLASENDNDYFEIEETNQSKNLSFSTIGRIKSKGNSSTGHRYGFNSNVLSSGMHYFRIKQTDLDGKNSYSETKALLIESEHLTATFASQEQQIIFSGELPRETTVHVSDILGRTLFAEQLGNDTNEISITPITNGIVLVHLQFPSGKMQTITLLK